MLGGQVNTTKQTLTYVQNNSTNLQTTLSATQNKLLVAQQTLSGLGITLATSKECRDVTLIDNPAATNPTWDQLVAFLYQDQTDKHTYIENVYDCSQFSRDIHNNAEARGIRAAEVQVGFINELTGHALNAFLTTDYGLVYVDSTQSPDTIARVKAVKVYRTVGVNRILPTSVRNDYWWDSLDEYYYLPSDTGDEVVTELIMIYW